MDTLFGFEESLAKSLGCIPMAVRRKLDLVGVKLSLAQWTALSVQSRRELLESPVGQDASAWEKLLVEELSRRGEEIRRLEIEPDPAWSDTRTVPGIVQDQCQAHGLEISPEKWAGLGELARFALCKLSRAGHENKNFVPAAREFGL